jgi:hypothetical protein
MGFREVGIYEKHARLDDAWRDVVIVERPLPRNLTSRAARTHRRTIRSQPHAADSP